MSAITGDKKLDGAGLATLWGIIKQYITDNPSIPKATASVLGGIMVGTTLAANSSGVLNLASGVVSAGTYKSVTVDTYGRVTAGSNPNTLAGYGITDAKISNGSIILGENSITPITSLSGYATQTWVQNQGYLTEETYKGTVTQVKVGTTAYNPLGGVISLPEYPTTLPASDVYSWAKAASKPSYTASEVGAATSGHTHTTSIATSSGTNQLTLAFGTKYVLTAGGTSYIFTMPSNPNTNTTYKFTIGSTTNGDATNGVDLGTLKSETAAASGTTLSLVTTGEKATWNAKSNLTIGTTATTAAAGNHTHTLSIATSSGTNALTLAANTKYVLTAGGSTFIFTTPTDTNTWRPLGTGATDACAGNDSRLSDSRPASDVYSWAKASSKPTYTASEVGAATSGHTHTTSIATSTGTNQITLSHGGKYAITAGGTSYIFTMPSDNNTTYSAGTGLSLSGTTFSLATSGVTAGTYKRVTVDAYGRVTSGDNTDANDNTWRNIYTGGTSRVGTGTDTKAINFVAGSNVSISYEAAGTDSGQSGNASYFNVKIAATDTTYSAATQSAAGLMSAADKTKLDGIASGANAYSLPAASTSALGGIKVNYTNSGKNYKVQLDSSNNAYVNVPWENTTYTIPTKVSQLTNDSGYITSYTNTWRNVYLAGTEKVGSGTGTKGLNFVAGSNITITYEAAGTSSGQSGNANYFNIKIAATDTNTWRPLGTGASDACAGNDSRLSNSRPASDVYSWAKASTKPSYAFNEITAGAATIGDGANYVSFRTNATYESGIYYSTPGNEAMVFANKYNVTSWIFANTSPSGRADWTGLTPAMQIKKNCVYINSLIASGTDPSYNLYVNGSMYVTSINGVNVGSSPKFTDTTYTFTNKGATLAWSTTSTIATVGGVDIKVTMPANPNTDHYAWTDITGKPSTFAPSSHSHSTIVGSYTGDGGQQNPNYFGKNLVGFLMMNTTVNSNSQYKDWIIMDCYNGTDVGGGVAFGVNRQSLGAYIMRSAPERTAWAESAELLGTHNYSSYAAKKTEAIKSISRSGTTFTATRCDGTTFTFTQQDSNTTYSSLSAVSGGTNVSLVTTGEKYTWNSKADGSHTHALSLATDSGNSAVTLVHGSKYKLTAGGGSVIFTMPSDNNTNTTYTIATGDSNGQIKVTPSSGSAYNVSVKGLGSNAYTSTSYLPLSGGTSYSMTGTLYIGTSLGITDASGNGLLCYHPGTWVGVTSSQWGLGTTDSQGVIRSSASNLVHYKGDTAYDILDSSNSSVSLSGSTLTVKINGTSQSLTNTNTTYSANNGVGLSGTTFYNSGVRAATINGNYLRVNTNGTNADLTIPYASSAGSATNDSDGNAIKSTYLKLSGGTLTGNVGIGTTSPAYKLDVVGVSRSDYHVFYNTAHTGEAGYIGRGGSSSNDLLFCTYGANALRFLVNSAEKMIISADGNVGIRITPTYSLHVSGNVGATGFVNTSDIRTKNIVKDNLSVKLTDIANAPLFDFKWKDTSIDTDLHIGSSAQYWKNVIPEAVSVAKDEIGTLSMQYDVIALSAVISVAKETLTLKEKVALLETRVKALEDKVREYEAS